MKFYVYELVVVPDGNVCYVGKGTGTRMEHHRRILRSVARFRQPRLYEKLRELLSIGKDYEPRKVFETDDELAALAEERRRIALYGMRNLFNSSHLSGSRAGHMDAKRRQAVADGVRRYYAKMEVAHGYKVSPEIRAKISASNMGRVITQETTDKRQRTWRSHPENVDKARQCVKRAHAANKGTTRTPEQVEALRKVLIGKPKHAGFGKRLSDAKRGHAPRHSAKSSYLGVSWRARKGIWEVYLCLHKKMKYVGSYRYELDAAWAYDNACELEFGKRPNNTPKEHTVTRFAGKGIKRPVEVGAKISATRRLNSNRPVGVRFKKGKWWVTLCYAKREIRLGRYLTEHEARTAYDDRFQALFGRRPNGTTSATPAALTDDNFPSFLRFGTVPASISSNA